MPINYPYQAVIQDITGKLSIASFSAGEFMDEAIDEAYLGEGNRVIVVNNNGKLFIPEEVLNEHTRTKG